MARAYKGKTNPKFDSRVRLGIHAALTHALEQESFLTGGVKERQEVLEEALRWIEVERSRRKEESRLSDFHDLIPVVDGASPSEVISSRVQDVLAN